MKSKYKFLYTISSCLIYMLITLFEYFCLRGLVDYVSTSYKVHLAALLVCLVVINPIITYILISKLPFKPALRLKGNINEDMKKQV